MHNLYSPGTLRQGSDPGKPLFKIIREYLYDLFYKILISIYFISFICSFKLKNMVVFFNNI